MSGIQMVRHFMCLNHLNTGHPYCPVFRWIWYSGGYFFEYFFCRLTSKLMATICHQNFPFIWSHLQNEDSNFFHAITIIWRNNFAQNQLRFLKINLNRRNIFAEKKSLAECFRPKLVTLKINLKMSDHFPKKKNLAEYFYPNLRTFLKNQLKRSDYFCKNNPENPKLLKLIRRTSSSKK